MKRENSKARVSFATLGCRVNQWDTDALATLFRRSGYQVVPFGQPAEVCVINTCAVTGESVRQSRQLARRARRLLPGAVVALVGCYPEAEREEAEALPEVDVILGTRERRALLPAVEEALRRRKEAPRLLSPGSPRRTRRGEPFEDLPREEVSGRTRAVIKVQEGCDEFCSYCIVPLARGGERSRPVESIVREAEELSRRGHREVVLAGTHLSAYGRDLGRGPGLAQLLLELEKVEGVERIRLSSLEPSALEEDFFQLLPRLRKLCPHFHLPLQSGSDRILGLMRRRYSTERFRNIIHRLRETFPHAGVSTDVIAGFPGEDEDDHRRTMEFCREMEFSHLHVFPFSPRRRTLAARLPRRVPEETKKRRVRELLELGAELSRSFRQKHVGRTVSVLVEGEREGWLEGLSAEGLRVHFRNRGTEGTETKTVKPGEIVEVRVLGLREDGVEGRLEG